MENPEYISQVTTRIKYKLKKVNRKKFVKTRL